MVEYRGTYIKTSAFIPLVPGLLLVIQVDEQGLWFPNLWTGIRMKHIPWNEINSIRYELVSGFRWPNLVLDREGQDKPCYVALPALSKKLRLQLMEYVNHYMELKDRAERQEPSEIPVAAPGS